MARPMLRWNADLLQSLPDDGNRYEVIDGELFVTPAPSEDHQTIAFELAILLKDYCESVGLKVLLAPFAVKFSRAREVQPDLVVMPKRPSGAPRKFGRRGELHLVCEVLSKTTGWRDRGIKRRVYQEQGVPEYWIIDGRDRSLDRVRQRFEEPECVTGSLTWQPFAEHAPLVIDLDALFTKALGS